jgi:N-acetylglucosaminyldiphosphoundecaprenol N-acetyl-beta-D-mannosaminyltransferase
MLMKIPPAKTQILYGIKFSNLSRPEVLQRIEEFAAAGKKGFVVTPNVDHVVRVGRDAEFKEAYERATLVLPDGMPVVFTSRLLKKPLTEKNSGSDIFADVIKLAAEKDLSIFLLGASEKTSHRGAKKLRREFPGLRLGGRFPPPWGFEKDKAKNEEVIRRINEAAPDLLFIFLGSPKQEIWIKRHIERLDIKLAFCFGAALDFYAGTIRRSPVWMQKAGLEWFWRIGHEPRRLGKRYLIDNLFPFLKIFLAEFRNKSER